MLEPWRDYHPLESPLYKILWAYKHLDTIDNYVRAYYSLNPHPLVYELNADKTFYECRILAMLPPFVDFSIAIGEFAYQLRSALDQIIFALSDFSGLVGWDLESAERHTSFPIFKRRNDAYIKGQLDRIPETIRNDVWEILDSEQPYQKGDLAEYDLLAVLEEMNIRDKHRVLRPSNAKISFGEGLDPRIQVVATGSAQHGDLLALVPSDLDPQVHLKPFLSSEIKIEIPRPSGGVGLSNLGNIYQRVAHVVLPKFWGSLNPCLQGPIRKWADSLEPV